MSSSPRSLRRRTSGHDDGTGPSTVRLTIVVCSGFAASGAPQRTVDRALERWGIGRGSVLDRRAASSDTDQDRARHRQEPVCTVKEFTDQVTAARKAAAQRGDRELLILPHAADPVPSVWIESVLRVTPTGSGRVELAKISRQLPGPRNRLFREVRTTDPHSLARMLRASRLLLVEGRTDQAVFTTLLQRWAVPSMDVVPANSKVRLAALRALTVHLGICTYLVFDADGGPVGAGPARTHRVVRTRRIQTENLLATLPKAPGGWQFGEPTVIGAHWSAFGADLEQELAAWGSFVEALNGGAREPVDKNVRSYRAAAQEAHLDDLPPALQALRRRLSELATYPAPEEADARQEHIL